MNVLLVGHEINLAKETAKFLKKHGYVIEIVDNKKDAEEKIFVNSYDFILMDIVMPDGDGFEILNSLKVINSRDESIIVLSAQCDVLDIVQSLEKGADDFLSKPFSQMELLARMHAITRRKHRLESNNIFIHGFEIDMKNRTVEFGKTRLNLTKKEFDIFYYLVLNKNRLISRIILTEHIWGDILEVNSDSNFVDVHVKNLRKKLANHSPILWFETVRGIGFRING